MTQQKKSDVLLAAIREGKPLVSAEKLNLIIGLSVPSILAQITSVLMFFIDQAMVGRISVEASAACGLVESSTWLFGSLTSAASMGFSVQVAHFIGANDFSKARQVFRHGLFCTLFLSIVIAISKAASLVHIFLLFIMGSLSPFPVSAPGAFPLLHHYCIRSWLYEQLHINF